MPQPEEGIVRIVGRAAQPTLGDDGDVPDGRANARPAGDGLGRILLGRQFAAGVEHLVFAERLNAKREAKSSFISSLR
jgi:hypothetical protein